MDKQFGYLRSLLHGTPSRAAWRRICRVIAQADPERAREELVPYADVMLDRGWPAALRTPPFKWMEQLEETRQPPASWPLVRTLLQLCDADQIALLDAEQHLRAISHVNMNASAPDAALNALFRAELSLELFHYIGSYNAETSYAPLMERHRGLRSLSLKTWGGRDPLTLPFEQHPLPALATLDLHEQRISDASLLGLLTSHDMPALRALRLRVNAPPAAAKLEHAPLIAQLTSLELRFDSPAALAMLALRARRPRLERLSLSGPLDAAALQTLRSIPAPRALHLSGARMSDADAAALARWSGLDAAESLTLHGAITHAPQPPQGPQTAALLAATRPAARSVTLLNIPCRDLGATLTREPWPALTRLHIDDCPISTLDPARLRDAWPALTDLTLTHITAHDGRLAHICDAQWFPQLRALSLLNTTIPADAQIALMSALHAHPALEALNLTSTGLTPARLRHLCRADLPRLHTLRLGRLPDITRDDLDHLARAPWLPQLSTLTLSFGPHSVDPTLRTLNLRAHLIAHGARHDLHIST
jgi:hypothetical protein